MTRAPIRFFFDTLASPIGDLLLATDEEGVLRALDFQEYDERMRLILRRRYGEVILEPGAAPESVTGPIRRYFAGDFDALREVPWRTAGTAFQQSVWEGLTRIPPGQTLSYGALAVKIGAPTAVRAVGLANGSNPIPLVAPCHRVIGADGSLTGFGGGLHRKRWLLTHEGAAFADRVAA
jgi:methylated-DNA-[protein]-cysteine S-methyltransferase